MLDALMAIVNGVGVAMNFIISFFSSLIGFFSLIGQSLAYATAIGALMPLPLTAFITAGLSIGIVMLLIGR